MSMSGAPNLLAAARTALFDALDALHAHLDAVVIGAQAIYLHTGAAPVALAEATKDSDLAIDARMLSDSPLLEQAMVAAGFHRDLLSPQPGSWISPNGIPVDLMVPEALAGTGGRRGARIPPHSNDAARRANGLEAAVVDHVPMRIQGLAPGDNRTHAVNVASPAALLVAKLHKLGERQNSPRRLVDKDAHDLYRLLVSVPTDELARSLARLLDDDLSGPATSKALGYLTDLFAVGPDAPGSTMAGRAEEGIGNPETVSASAAILARDLLAVLEADSP